MPLISLEAGLVVRRGARVLEFVRLLDDSKVQFQDPLTRHIQTMTLARFYHGVQSRQLIPVLAEEPHAADVKPGPLKPQFIRDISSLPKKDTAVLRRRMAYVRAMRKRGISRGQRDDIAKRIAEVAARLEDPSPPSASTVMEWMRRFEKSSQNTAALLSGNCNRRRERRIPQCVEDVVNRKLRTIYLTRARHTLRHTMDHIRCDVEKLHMAGKIAPHEAKVSMATLHRRLREMDPYQVTKLRYGVNRARAEFRTSVEGTQAIRPLQRLECDHTLLNWVVVCDRTGLPLGRPTLTIIVDSFSGYVVGIYVSFYGPGLTSVLNVLKNTILPKEEIARSAGCRRPWLAFGIGETLLLDNGLEFHSPQFQMAAWELGMDLEYCRVRTPWLKPKVERFFLNLDYFSLSRGRVRKPLGHVEALDPKKDAAITLSDLLSGLIKFVVDIYPFEENSRTLQMPFELFRDGLDELPPPAFPVSFDQLDLIAAMSCERTVGSGGVELRGIPYSSTALARLKKVVGCRFRTRVKWNPDDLSLVHVQNPKDLTWLAVQSLWGRYTEDLSWVQHLLIRRHRREQRVAGGHEEALWRSRLELNEMWLNPLARRNRAVDPRALTRYAGVSASSSMRDDVRPVAPIPGRLLAPEEVIVERSEDIPDFEAFDMA